MGEKISKKNDYLTSKQNNKKINNSKQKYKQQVLKSNIFLKTPLDNGRWPNNNNQNKINNNCPSIRLYDSNSTPKQLEWQKQRRVQTRQKAMNSCGVLGGPKIVQKHAEMRAYLLHCQRVLTARSRLDTGLKSNGHSSLNSSSIRTSPSIDGSLSIEGLTIGTKTIRANSVPANRRKRIITETEKQLREENKRLLERIVQISTRSTSANQKIPKENEKIKRITSSSLKW